MLAAAQVRQLVAQRLIACALTAGKVDEGRYTVASEAELPRWFVAIDPGEDIGAEGLSWPRLLTHTLRIRAEGVVQAADGLEALLDTLQLQGLQALFGEAPPYQLQCIGVRRQSNDGSGQAADLGALVLHLEATYRTVEGDPETLIP